MLPPSSGAETENGIPVLWLSGRQCGVHVPNDDPCTEWRTQERGHSGGFLSRLRKSPPRQINFFWSGQIGRILLLIPFRRSLKQCRGTSRGSNHTCEGSISSYDFSVTRCQWKVRNGVLVLKEYASSRARTALRARLEPPFCGVNISRLHPIFRGRRKTKHQRKLKRLAGYRAGSVLRSGPIAWRLDVFGILLVKL